VQFATCSQEASQVDKLPYVTLLEGHVNPEDIEFDEHVPGAETVAGTQF
jgi:hypothetical protein